MVLSLNNLAEPIGSVKSWLRANNTIPLPSGWLICDGSTVVDASSPYNGKALPDFRGRFVRGHATLDNMSFSSDTIYFAGGTIPNGGADTNNLQHSHNGPNHSHLVSSGQFSMPAAGGSLMTSVDGAHTHNAGAVGGSIRTDPGVFTDIAGDHSHSITGRTGMNDTSFSTENSGTGNTDSRLSPTTENRPAFRELLIIIKIK